MNKAKKVTCKAVGCRVKFYPINSFHRTCSPKCAIKLVEAKKKKKASEQRKVNKKRLEALQPYSYWVKRTQAACNKYIRLRDKGKPCISCGRHHAGQYHAGHFMSTGSTPALRFHPANIWLQCAPCNNHLSGNIVNYRQSLVSMLGEDFVEYLENSQVTYAPTVEELKEIEAYYKELIKCF